MACDAVAAILELEHKIGAEAVQALDRLSGRKMTRKLVAEAEQAVHELEGQLK